MSLFVESLLSYSLADKKVDLLCQRLEHGVPVLNWKATGSAKAVVSYTAHQNETGSEIARSNSPQKRHYGRPSNFDYRPKNNSYRQGYQGGWHGNSGYSH